MARLARVSVQAISVPSCLQTTNRHRPAWRPSIKYVTLFLANFDPSPVTLCHTSRDPPKVRHTSRTPPPIFSRPSTKNRTKVPCTNSVSILHGGFCLESFVRGGFCPFPLLSEYICYNRKLNITLNFMFHMYDKKIISVTSHALYPPVTNCHTCSDPLPSRA